MMEAQPIWVMFSFSPGRAAEMACQPPAYFRTIGVAIARPTRMMPNWMRSETWSAIMPPKVV